MAKKLQPSWSFRLPFSGSFQTLVISFFRDGLTRMIHNIKNVADDTSIKERYDLFYRCSTLCWELPWAFHLDFKISVLDSYSLFTIQHCLYPARVFWSQCAPFYNYWCISNHAFPETLQCCPGKPKIIRTWKLSRSDPGRYLAGRPPRNIRGWDAETCNTKPPL